MRAQTLRSIRYGFVLAAAGTALLTSAPARAEGATSSTGSAALKFEQTTGLPTTIETGFLGPSAVKVNVGIAIDPVIAGGPLFTVDMPKGALIEASWSNDQKIVLKARTGSSSDGLVTVRHTLTPKVDLKFAAWGLNADFSYDATKLLAKIPGSKFAFDSKAQAQFAPWGFTAVDTKLNAPDLEKATLFSMDMQQLPDLISNNVKGTFGVKASTQPTFSYKTTKIVLSGADGEIHDAAGEISVAAVDGDYMEVMAAVEGEMTVAGSISVRPFVTVTSVGNTQVGSTFDISAYSKDFTTPVTKLPFQTVLVHIPMPNVRVPARGVNLGDVKAGGSASKTISIENSGEKDAVMTFSSSDAAFKVTSESVTVPAKSSYDLSVKFAPESANPASSEITVSSNDADAPVQTFKIGANGADVGADADKSSAQGSDADSGCGCKTAGTTTTSSSGWAAFGLFGLAASVLVRRRRQAV